MHSTRWLAVAVLAVVGVFGTLGGTEAEAQSYDAAEVEVIELINAYRQENGLGTVSLSSPLSVASERHSEDMGTYGFFAHDTAQSSYYEPGSGHSERIAQEGYDYDTFTAENLAYGQTTPQEAFEAWRNSPGHNEAMLGDYSVVGVGLVNVGGVPYWTTVFGAEADPSAQPVGAAPSPGDAAGEPTAQSEQYDNAATEAEQPIATDEQYDETPATNADNAETAADEQYDTPDDIVTEEAVAEEAAADEQYDGDAPESGAADTSAADQYEANAESLRAAADQYGEEARQAESEIAALQAGQSQPTAATETVPAEAPVNAPTNASTNAPANAPAAPSGAAASAAPVSVGAVSPEPQVSAPGSATQEIPVPSVEDATAVQSAGQSAGEAGGGDSEGAGQEIGQEISEGAGSGGSSAGQSESPSEAMASVGMTVLPDTGGLPVGGIGAILGASFVVCLLATTRRLLG